MMSENQRDKPQTTRVVMGLTERDESNAAHLVSAASLESRAHAVSVALSLTRYLVDAAMAGEDVLLRQKDGTLARVRMVELPL